MKKSLSLIDSAFRTDKNFYLQVSSEYINYIIKDD